MEPCNSFKKLPRVLCGHGSSQTLALDSAEALNGRSRSGGVI
jgi:hypothetical protein